MSSEISSEWQIWSSHHVAQKNGNFSVVQDFQVVMTGNSSIWSHDTKIVLYIGQVSLAIV